MTFLSVYNFSKNNTSIFRKLGSRSFTTVMRDWSFLDFDLII